MHSVATNAESGDAPRWPRRHPARRWLPGVLLLAGVIIFADALVGEQSLSTGRRARRQSATLGTEIQTLREQNGRLRNEIRRLREDPDTIEFVARKDLGLAGRGEILFLLK